MHPKHLQAVATGDWKSAEIPRGPRQTSNAGQALHRGHQGQRHGADGRRSRYGKKQIIAFRNCDFFLKPHNPFLCISDFYNAAVDVVRTGQAPQPPGGAEGGGGGSSG